MQSGSLAREARKLPLGLRFASVAVLSLASALGVSEATAQIPSTAAASTSQPAFGSATTPPAPVEPAIPEAPDSPRASMREFFKLAREGRFDEAARYLDVPPKGNGPQLAQRLKAVLDRNLWIDPGDLSPLSLGDPKDGVGVEELGTIPGAPKGDTVRLVRRVEGTTARWVFSRATVERVDSWYSRLDDRWLREILPEALLRPGPRELLWWQWLALPLLCLTGWLVGKLLSFLSQLTFGRVVARTEIQLDDQLLERSRGPVTFSVAIGVVAVGTSWLGLYGPAENFINRVLSAAFFIAIFWAALRVIDASTEHLLVVGQARDNASARSLAPLAGRIAKVMVAIIGVIAVLSELGYPVASLIAGLGIGGVALALAAQKTVENLFGSISIGLDRPFRVGDFVMIDGTVLGTVEAIGLRSTRVRTLDRTLVTMPNGKLADMRVESYTARDRFRLTCIIAVVYGTTSTQLQAVMNEMEAALRRHPKIWPDDVVVRFQGFGVAGLEIEVMAWFKVPDFGSFRGVRQEVLLEFMKAVEDAGTRFALPAQRLHIMADTGNPFGGSSEAPLGGHVDASATVQGGPTLGGNGEGATAVPGGSGKRGAS
ncbi:mechanosensitive ion channel family protein [Chondromyces crocatus]|uniref:Mechanosensitive ion channel protein MscS n=1 Tax=Chondromyces crocatus TaxID=52 RepID=A0A0K1EJH9_CHOCO|nr:mechanosensitive ion channel family protein [Chondromyces crocatus]AKT41026.1 uncharacterized protein CMC5_051840 [Chondromyces crocatus]